MIMDQSLDGQREWKSCLETQHAKTKIMVSGPITSWQQWQTSFSWAPKSQQMVTTAMKLNDTCSLEGKLLKKTLDSILKKQRHFADKGPYTQSYGFSSSYVQMWELDHKKAAHQGIDAFELWCWRRLFRVPLTAKKSNQSILKEINPEYSLEGLMLKLKLQYFGHLM